MEDKKQRRFFKVISPSCMEHQWLEIPDKFTRDFGKKLGKSVVVKIPSGKEWRLELIKDKSKVYFHHGWDDFMKYNSIHVWQFLVFQYHGNSVFEVAIFDISGLEIEYPCHTIVETDSSPSFHAKTKKRKFDHNGKRGKLSFDHEEDIIELDENVQVQYTDDVTCSLRKAAKQTHAKLSYESLQSINNLNSKQELEQPDDPMVQESCDVFGSIFRRTNQSKAPAIDSEKVHQERMSSLTSRGVKKATQILPIKPRSELRSTCSKRLGLRREEKATTTAGEFTSKYPFCTVYMCHTYVYKRYLSIPFVFGRKHLQGVREITLRVSNGKTWKIRCSSRKARINLLSKWHSFVVDNHLGEGDVCIFELVDKNKMELQVSIFHVGSEPFPTRGKLLTNNVSLTSRHATSLQNERKILEATSFHSEKPFCTVTIRPSYLNTDFYLHMPKAFASKYLKDGYKGITLRGLDGGTWPVHCQAGDPHKCRRGWKAFASDNNLKVGDICIFELTDTKNVELKVYIFRCS